MWGGRAAVRRHAVLMSEVSVRQPWCDVLCFTVQLVWRDIDVFFGVPGNLNFRFECIINDIVPTLPTSTLQL